MSLKLRNKQVARAYENLSYATIFMSRYGPKSGLPMCSCGAKKRSEKADACAALYEQQGTRANFGLF